MDDTTADDTTAEAAGSARPRVEELPILDRIEAELADVDRALERLDGGTYGRCDACGERIPDERLARAPAARFCTRHQPGAAV